METQVKVPQEHSDQFLVNLRETESKFSTVNPKEFRGALEKFIGEQWGAHGCRSFSGANGQPSWVLDISDVLGGLMYYAVISSSKDGRQVVGFVDEDVVAQVVHDGSASRIENPEPEVTKQMLDESAPVVQAELEPLRQQLEQERRNVEGLGNEIESLRGQLELLKSKPDDPVLVRHKPTDAAGNEADWVPIITKQANVGEVIADLLEKGVKAPNIEVWSRKSSPRVKIEW